MEKSRIIDPTEYGNWDEMLLDSSGRHFFLSSSWADVFKSTYHYKPYYQLITRDEKIRFLLPMMEVDSILTGRRAISLPFTDYCEPICQDEATFNEAMAELVVLAQRKRWRTVEFRGGHVFLAQHPASRCYFSHTLGLQPDPGGPFAQFHNTTKRNIKKAERAGVMIEIAGSLKALEAFYHLNCKTRKKHGLPPQPYSFFRSVYEKIIAPGKGLLLVARAENTIIAAAMFFVFGDQIIYKYGASDERYQALRANNLIMWKAIEYGCTHGYRSFDFGKTEPSNEGLRRYKLNWGASENIIRYYKYHVAKSQFISEAVKEHHWTNQIFSRMPPALLKVLGSLLYTHAA